MTEPTPKPEGPQNRFLQLEWESFLESCGNELQTATHVQTDAFIVTFFRDTMHSNPHVLVRLMTELRKARAEDRVWDEALASAFKAMFYAGAKITFNRLVNILNQFDAEATCQWIADLYAELREFQQEAQAVVQKYDEIKRAEERV